MLAAPVLWAVCDLVVTGDPLYSLHGTQDLAEQLERPREVGTAFSALPSYLRYALGDPIMWLGLAGAAAGLLSFYERTLLPAALAVAGLLGLSRARTGRPPTADPLPARPCRDAVPLLRAAGVGLDRAAAPHTGPGARGLPPGLLCLVAVAAYAPRQARALNVNREHAVVTAAIQDDLHRIADDPGLPLGRRPLPRRCEYPTTGRECCSPTGSSARRDQSESTARRPTRLCAVSRSSMPSPRGGPRFSLHRPDPAGRARCAAGRRTPSGAEHLVAGRGGLLAPEGPRLIEARRTLPEASRAVVAIVSLSLRTSRRRIRRIPLLAFRLSLTRIRFVALALTPRRAPADAHAPLRVALDRRACAPWRG